MCATETVSAQSDLATSFILHNNLLYELEVFALCFYFLKIRSNAKMHNYMRLWLRRKMEMFAKKVKQVK